MAYINHILFSALMLSLFATETSAVIKSKKNLFDIGCATLCQDHVGDPIDVSGVEFADLVTEYLEQEGGGGGNNSTGGNSTDMGGNFTDMGGNSTTSDDDGDIKLLYGEISCWDVSAVTDMSDAFAFQDEFNSEIGCWEVTSVSDMSNMFLGATSFNEDLNIWSEKVPRENIDTTDMFKDSGCEVTSDPDTIGRPWCQYKQPEFSDGFKCFFFGDC